MSGRLLFASSLALLLASHPLTAAAQPPDLAAPIDGEAPPPPADPPPEDIAPGDPPAPPADPPPASAPPESPAAPDLAPTTEPPPTAPADPADPFDTPAVESPRPRPAPPPPAIAAPTKSSPPPPPSTTAPAPTPDPVAPGGTASAPQSSPGKPARKETVREAARRRTDEDRRQRFRHGGFILDARIGGTGCLRAICNSTASHHAAPGLHLGGFVGFNLFGLIELGLEGGWNTLRPRGLAGRNAMTLYGLDPAVLQQALAGQDQRLPLPDIDFSALDVTSGTSRAFDIGPSLRIHLLRKGRGLLFVGAGAHYQLWRNRYGVADGTLRVDLHGASLPLKVGGGAFITRNLALMAEVSYAPAIFGAMSVHLPGKTGVAPLKIIEDLTGARITRNLPHFWTIAFTVRFRL